MKAEVVYEDATKYIKVVDAQKLQANLPEERIDWKLMSQLCWKKE